MKKCFFIVSILFLVVSVNGIEMPKVAIGPVCNYLTETGCFDSDGNDFFKSGKTSLCTEGGTTTRYDQCMTYKQVEEWICENGNLESTYFECPYKCKQGECLLLEPTCEDSDGGKEILVKGSVNGKDEFGNPIENVDSCKNSLEIKEFFCDEGDIKSVTEECPLGYYCDTGACLKDATGHLLVADNKAPSSDVIIMTDLGIHLKYLGYDNIAPAKLNSEVTKDMLDNRVTTFIYLGEAVIIVGKNSPSAHNTLANVIEDFLKEEKDIKAKTISSSKVSSDDLTDLFPKAVTGEETEEEEPEISPISIPSVEKDGCTSDSDCNDNNACTTDLCSGTPKKCSNTETTGGCNYNKKCIPIGVRVFNEYCDIDKEVYAQKAEDEPCKNNYECISNICVNDKCISPGLIRRILNWFKGIVGYAVKSI